MKKFVGFLLALAMMASMVIPAMAAGEPDVLYDAAAYQAQTQESVNKAIVKAGGKLNQINVKLNDKCIAFPDAVPELQNGSTMVPVRALMEALGAKVTMDKNTVTIVLGTTSIQMVVGDAVATVDKNGTKEQVKLGAASYLKGDRVYIPLRFVSEVLGFQVKWDQDYKSVVILDRASIVKKLNERFGTANVFMQSQSKYFSGNWMTEGTFNVNVEVMNNIDGNKTFTATGTSKTHCGNGAMTMDATLDLSKAAGMLDSFKTLSAGEGASALAMLKSYMKANQFSIRMLPQGDYYVKSELYDLMATNLMGATLDKNKETWYHMGRLDPSLVTAEGYTVGNYLYSMIVDPEVSLQTPFMAYDTMMQTAGTMERFMGDNCFKKQGDNYVLSMNKDQILGFAGENKELKETLNSVFQELNLTISFTKDGTYSMQGAVKLKMDGIGSLMDLKLDQSGTTTDATGNMQLQVRNLFNMTMKAKSTASKTQSAPDASIPKDAQIIDYMKLMKEMQ